MPSTLNYKVETTTLAQYTLHGQVLETVDGAKYLGVTISQHLNWNTHMHNITAKVNRNLGLKTRNEAVIELAYKMLVRIK